MLPQNDKNCLLTAYLLLFLILKMSAFSQKRGDLFRLKRCALCTDTWICFDDKNSCYNEHLVLYHKLCEPVQKPQCQQCGWSSFLKQCACGQYLCYRGRCHQHHLCSLEYNVFVSVNAVFEAFHLSMAD